MIVYFSATGNSRYTAKMLAELLNDESYCANGDIKNRTGAELRSDKPWVFVCPIYLSALPAVFEDFIRKSRFSGSKQAYFVVTSAGTSPCGCPGFAVKLAEEKGFTYMETANVTMPQNYLVFFQTKEKAECDKIIEAAKPRIEALAALIAAGKPFPDPGMKNWELLTTRMILKPYAKLFMNADKFTASGSCIGCGACVRACPMGNVKLTAGRPVWGDECIHCMACINLCPKTAIEYGRLTEGKPRYRCPEYKGY